MWRVVVVFNNEVAIWEVLRTVGYCVSLFFVVMECSTWIVRVCGGANEDVAME